MTTPNYFDLFGSDEISLISIFLHPLFTMQTLKLVDKSFNEIISASAMVHSHYIRAFHKATPLIPTTRVTSSYLQALFKELFFLPITALQSKPDPTKPDHWAKASSTDEPQQSIYNALLPSPIETTATTTTAAATTTASTSTTSYNTSTTHPHNINAHLSGGWSSSIGIDGLPLSNNNGPSSSLGFWSSTGSIDSDNSFEQVSIRLLQPSIVSDVTLAFYRATYLTGCPIFTSKIVQFALSNNEESMDFGNSFKTPNMFHFVSPRIPVTANSSESMMFSLPEKSLAKFIRIKFIGATTTQPTDNLYYICLRSLSVNGTLSGMLTQCPVLANTIGSQEIVKNQSSAAFETYSTILASEKDLRVAIKNGDKNLVQLITNLPPVIRSNLNSTLGRMKMWRRVNEEDFWLEMLTEPSSALTQLNFEESTAFVRFMSVKKQRESFTAAFQTAVLNGKASLKILSTQMGRESDDLRLLISLIYGRDNRVGPKSRLVHSFELATILTENEGEDKAVFQQIAWR